MEIRSLQYFLMVAREENITKAANLLHLTQPTLSRSMMQLEEELGVKLFHRSNHRIILTEDGMLLKRRAQEIVTLAEKTKQDFKRGTTELNGEIAIGSGEFKSTRFLSQLIRSFHQKHPLVQYQLYSGNTENVTEQIEHGLLDFGLMAEPVDISRYDYITMPIKEKWGVWVREDSPLAQKEGIAIEDLFDVPLISSRGEYQMQELQAYFGGHFDRLKIVARGNLLYNEAILAQDGLGTVLGIELECAYQGLKFVSLKPAVQSSTALVWKKQQMLSRATRAFIAHVKEYSKSISDNNL